MIWWRYVDVQQGRLDWVLNWYYNVLKYCRSTYMQYWPCVLLIPWKTADAEPYVFSVELNKKSNNICVTHLLSKPWCSSQTHVWLKCCLICCRNTTVIWLQNILLNAMRYEIIFVHNIDIYKHILRKLSKCYHVLITNDTSDFLMLFKFKYRDDLVSNRLGSFVIGALLHP